MLIGIDGNEANVNNRVGSNIYAFEVLRNLYFLRAKSEEPIQQGLRLSSAECLQGKLRVKSGNLVGKADKFIVYLREKPLPDLPQGTEWWQYRVIGPKRFWTQIGLPFKLYTQKENLDVFFTPGHYAPRFCPYPLVITVLDTSYLSFPSYFKKDDLYQLKNWTDYSVKKAKKILTISENSKRDIIKYYNRKSEDIIVVYPGYDQNRFNLDIKNQSFDSFDSTQDKFTSLSLSVNAQDKKSRLRPPNGETTARQAKIKDINSKFKIKTDYIIYVGTIQPRKNIIRLLEAFKIIKPPDLKLVIVGKKGWLYEEIFAKVKELGLQDKVIFTGYVGDSDLPYLIAGAKLYILPSLYEGFGIPVAEALAVGTPVVVSRVSSLPEVAGKAGVYIENPENIDNIAEAIEKGLNLNQKERDEIIKRGLEQVKKFSWEKAGKGIFQILNNFR